ncbi:glycosyltransferase [Candidatus Saccharibacteria bacterium]|nr:glycosyltransferase [Candidatus Saccharibacteria bacterium]
MVMNKDEMEEYIKALEEELCASIEREKKLIEDDLGFGAFVMKKVKRSGLYKDIITNPDSKMGRVARAPRSFYRIIKNPEVRSSLLQKKTVNGTSLEENEEGLFLDPWMVNVENRKRITEEALAKNKKVALYYIEKPDSSTFRYRCFNTFEATKESKKWQAVYYFKDEIDLVKKFLPESNILVFGRQSGQEKTINELTKLAHKNGIKVGLDIDDLVFDMKYLDLMLDTIGDKVNRSYWLAYFGGVCAIAKQMDYFITTNKFLEKKIKESYDRPCRVIRNSLNQEQVNASLVYEKFKKRDDKEFVIGYFSGSPTHAKDFAVAEPELVRFLKKHDNAVLNVVGFMRFSKEMEKLVEAERVRFLPLTDFRKLQKLMAEVDVNIAPLVMNDFTNCKSELKFFEAAVVETTTIASPTYTFKKAITDGENGFLARPGEWYDRLEYLYKNPKKNREIALTAKKYALKYYIGAEFLKEVENTYDYFIK